MNDPYKQVEWWNFLTSYLYTIPTFCPNCINDDLPNPLLEGEGLGIQSFGLHSIELQCLELDLVMTVALRGELLL